MKRLLGAPGAKPSLLALALIAFFSIFADFLASDAPVVIIGRGGVSILPAVTAPAAYRGRRADAIAAALDPHSIALWPLVRSGPTTVSAAPLASPSRAHPLGTDAFGRDVFARLVHGARVVLGVGLAVTLIASVFGCLLGGLGAALGGFCDSLVERVIEIAGIFPAVIVIALVRAAERSPSLTSLLVVIALFRWTEAARLTRVMTLRALAEDWSQAARALGATRARILLRHVVPNIASPLLVSSIFSVAGAVLLETALSFLGLGAPAPFPSWGEMMGEIVWGGGPALVLLPALGLASIIGSLYVLGDAAARALDPRRAAQLTPSRAE